MADSESVRFGALKDLLDRAGLKPVERVEQHVTNVEQTSTDDLLAELRSLTTDESEEEIPDRLN
jgi:hypothetical protein